MAAAPPLIFADAILQEYYDSSAVHDGVAFELDEGFSPSVTPSIITANVPWSCLAVGFRRNLSWLLMEYCNLAEIVPIQLTLHTWGLIHSLQVLSDLSGVVITSRMIMGAFRLTEVADCPRRFNLSLREGRQSPVNPPLWIGSDLNYPEFFYIINQGANQIRHSWSPPGTAWHCLQLVQMTFLGG